MSDPESSGAATPEAGLASTPSTPPSPTPVPSAFSNNRGSGLARGKRPANPPAPTASAGPAPEYKPTAVSILTAPTEYKNPFAPPAPVAAPAEPAPAVIDPVPPTPAPAPVQAPLPAAPVATAPAAVSPVTSEPVRIPFEEPVRPRSSEPEPMPELKILPPEATKRVEHNWESESFRNVASQPAAEPGRPADAPRPPRDDRRNDRPVFRPERDRRDDRPADPAAAPRPAWAGPARPPGNESGRTESTPPPKPEAPAKSGGFFAWVKQLFGGAPAAAPKPEAPSEPRGERNYPQEGQYHRRRRRGGRGRNFQGNQRDPRDGQQGGQPGGDQRGYGGDQRGYGGEQRGYGGEQRGYGGDQRGQGRRRRHHGGGGGFRGNGRPEGGPPSGS